MLNSYSPSSVFAKRAAIIALCILVVFSSCFVPARAAEPVSGAAVAYAYLQASGFNFVVSGASAAASAAIESLASLYASVSSAFSSGAELLSALAAGATVGVGTITLTAAAAAVVVGFGEWLAYDYLSDIDVTVSVPYWNGSSVGNLALGKYTGSAGNNMVLDYRGTAFTFAGQLVELSDNVFIRCENDPYSSTTLFFNFVDAAGNILPYPGESYTCSIGVRCANKLTNTPVYFVIAPNFVQDDPVYVFYRHSSYSGYSYGQAVSGTVTGGADEKTAYTYLSTIQQYANTTAVIGSAAVALSDTVDISVDNTVISVPGIGVSTPADDIILPGVIAGTLAPSFGAPVDDTAEWNPALPVSGQPTVPEDPGTDSPFLPALSIPWHYVTRLIDDAQQFIDLTVIALQEYVPTAWSNAIYASIVIAVLFGLIIRFLG